VPPVPCTATQSAVGAWKQYTPPYCRKARLWPRTLLRTRTKCIPSVHVQAVADARGMPTVSQFVGHGIGRAFHGEQVAGGGLFSFLASCSTAPKEIISTHDDSNPHVKPSTQSSFVTQVLPGWVLVSSARCNQR
jgi:hypothetical protein